MYNIVEFTNEWGDGGQTVDVVPTNWITGLHRDHCFWPSGKGIKISMAVKNKLPPGQDWTKYPIRIIGTADSYASAREKLTRAEETSDLQTDSEVPKKRKRLPNKKFVQETSAGSSSESDEIPPTPPFELLPSSSKSLVTVNQTNPANVTLPKSSASSSACHITPTHNNNTPQRSLGSSAARNNTTPQRSAGSSAVHNNTTPQRSAGSSAVYNNTTPQRSADTFSAHDTVNPARFSSTFSLFVKILSMLEDIKETQRVHSNLLNTLVKNNSLDSLPELPEDMFFPLSSNDEVEILNLKLQDSKLMSTVISTVADVGGSSVDDAIRRMMKFLFSNEVALEYNLCGRHGKRRFRDLRLFDVVYGGLKKNILTKDVNQKEAELALSKWFTGARDRGGKRALRAQRSVGDAEAQTLAQDRIF